MIKGSDPFFIKGSDPFFPDPFSPHLGFRFGANHLRACLGSLEEIGVNHVVLNLCFNQAGIGTTLKRLAEDVLPDFSGPDFTE
jgi:hypothetical protein